MLCLSKPIKLTRVFYRRKGGYMSSTEVLAAMQDGWEEKACILDLDKALHAAKNALNNTPYYLQPRTSIEIYAERKRQISAMIDANFLLPSYSGAKKMHETLSMWCDLLYGLPFLNSSLLRNEISLCKALCRKSKNSFMPNERLVYVAYMEFNNKVSYGDSFEKRLQPLLIERESFEVAAKQDVRKALEQIEFVKDEKTERPSSNRVVEWKELIAGLSLKPLYQLQINELNQQLASLRPYHIRQRRITRKRIDDLGTKITSIDKELEEILEQNA